MRNLSELDRYRVSARELWGWDGDETCGAFSVPSPVDKAPMVAIASSGMGWDHVSVSRRNRSPNQRELDAVFRLFFREGETAVQYFVPADEHVNNHPYCLHLWRPQEAALPKPASIMVGVGNKQLSLEEAQALQEKLNV